MMTLKSSSKTSVTQALIAIVAVAGLSSACAPENPRLMAPPTTYAAAATEATPQVLNVTPMVDILMVIDNSDSMTDEQQTLSNNIDKFATGLAKNSNIDFHIGAVSVWDTAMFREMTKEYGHGELRRLKGPDGKNLPDAFGRFVSSREDYDSYLAKQGVSLKKEAGWLQVLKASMKIGVESYNPKHATEKTGGPEVEEIFSPVKAALSEPMASSKNLGFRRKGAHLVLIYITDADASVRNANETSFDISSGELQEFLRANIGGNYKDDVTAIGVLARSSDDPKERDPAIRHASLGPTEPVNIQSFIRDLGGKWMGLRGKDYGAKMAELGSYVRSRTLASPRVDLDAIPEWGTISVALNGETLKIGEGWQYDSARNSVVITRDLSGVNGAIDLKVGYTPVLASSVNSGRVHAQGL